MTDIVLNESELRDRRKDLLRLVEPLVDRRRVEIRQTGNSQKYTWGMTPKGYVPASTVFEEVRVATLMAGVYMNYYEVWIPSREKLKYYLERAYMHFHLKRAKDSPDKQILCLHCDPALSAADPSAQFKKGPHLHIGGAVPDIARSHIALCVGDPGFGGLTVHSLTGTLQVAVKMIANEVFSCYR